MAMEGTEGAQSPEGAQAGGPGRKRKRRALIAVIGAALLILLAEPAAVAGAALTAVGGGLYVTDPVRAVPQVVSTITQHTAPYVMPNSCGRATMRHDLHPQPPYLGPWTGAIRMPSSMPVWGCPRAIIPPWPGRVVTGQPVYLELRMQASPLMAPEPGFVLRAPGASVTPASALLVSARPASYGLSGAGPVAFSVAAQAPQTVPGLVPQAEAGQVTERAQAWRLEYSRPGTYSVSVGFAALAAGAYRGIPYPAIPAVAVWRAYTVRVAAGTAVATAGAPVVDAGLVWWPGVGPSVGAAGGGTEGPVYRYQIAYPGDAAAGALSMPARQPLFAVRSLPAGPGARWRVTGSMSGSWPQPPTDFSGPMPAGPAPASFPVWLPASARTKTVATTTTYRPEPLLLSLTRPGAIARDPMRQFEWPNLLAMAAGLLLLLLAVRRLRRRLATQTQTQTRNQ